MQLAPIETSQLGCRFVECRYPAHTEIAIHRASAQLPVAIISHQKGTRKWHVYADRSTPDHSALSRAAAVSYVLARFGDPK